MPDLFIDGRPVHAEKGQTVLQAARAAGITIPTFCWHPQLSVAGNCRVCVVEVEGEGGAAGWCEIACNMPVTEGMRVRTDSPAVQQRRQQALQFLLLNHPVDCGICDKAGECLLQDQHYEYNGAPSISTIPKVRATKYVELSQRIVLDNERCILCTRCVRFTREVSKSDALGVQHRGDESLIRSSVTTSRTNALEGDAYSDNVVDICPVGALLSKAFLHQARVWYLKPTPSVCPGCARGCKVDLWTRRPEWKLNAPYFRDETQENTRIVRVTPSAAQTGSATMPGPWICNWGRDLAKHLERPRATQAMERGEVVSLESAIDSARRLIGGAQRVVALVSSAASNEELVAFKSAFGGRFTCVVKSDRMAAPGEVVEDALLIRADKNPNSAGAQALFGDAEPVFPAGCDLVLAWGEGVPWTRLPPGVPTLLLGAYVAAENGHADVFLPISVQTERRGHYTNCDGELRAFEPCARKPDGVIDAEALFGALAVALRESSAEAAE